MNLNEKYETYRQHIESLVADGTLDQETAESDLAEVRRRIEANDPDAEMLLEITRE